MHEDMPESMEMQSAEAHLSCLQCGYDLTGIPEDRCPECGLPQARAWAQEWHNRPGLPPPFGLVPSGFKDRSVCYASLFQPDELGRRLPPFVDETQVMQHAWRMRALAGLVYLVFSLLELESLVFFPAVIVGLMAAASCCERLIVILLRLGNPMPPPPGFPFWLNLARTHATFLPLSALCFVGTIWLLPPTGRGLNPEMLVTLAPPVWWWLNVTRSFYARMPPDRSRLPLVLGLPFVAAVSVFVGLVAGLITEVIFLMLCSIACAFT